MDIVYIGEAFDYKPYKMKHDDCYIYVDINSNNFACRILFSHQEKANVLSYYRGTDVYKACFPLLLSPLILKDYIYLEYKSKTCLSSHNLYYIQLDKIYIAKIMLYIKSIVPVYDLYFYLSLFFVKIYLIDSIPDRLFPIFCNWKAFSIFDRRKKLKLVNSIFI